MALYAAEAPLLPKPYSPQTLLRNLHEFSNLAPAALLKPGPSKTKTDLQSAPLPPSTFY